MFRKSGHARNSTLLLHTSWQEVHHISIYEYVAKCVKIVLSALMVLYCGRVPAANAPGCTAAEDLFYKHWSLVFPTCTTSCLHQRP